MQDQYRPEGTVSLTIDRFSEFSGPGSSEQLQRLSSPTYIRGLPWRILAIPRTVAPSPKKPGEGVSSASTGKYLAFFLQCNGESSDPDWSCTASAILRIHPAGTVPGIKDYTRTIKHTFSSKENDWGYSQFMSLNDLADPENGYIKNDTVKLCVNVTADFPRGIPPCRTDLMNAANDGDVGVGFVLLEAGCDPDAAPVPTSRETALTIAAAKGYDKFVELLLQYNADINHRNKKGCTALFLAAENGHLDTVKVLVKNGADVDLQDNRKFLPLFAAFRRAHKEIVEFLVKYVTQFPSEEELFKCYQSCVVIPEKDIEGLDMDAIRKEVRKALIDSMKIINDTRRQLVQAADKAALNLLNQLAEEQKLTELRKMRQKEKKKAKRLAKKNQVSSGTQNTCESECSKNIEVDEVSSEKSLTLITTSTTSVLKLSVEESSSAACKTQEEPPTKNRPEPTVDQNQTKKKRRKKTSRNEKKEKEADDEKLSKRRLSTDKAEPRRLNHDLPPFDNECILLPDPSEPRPSTSKSICESPLTEVSSKIWQNHAETFSSTNSDEDEWIEASKKRNNPRIKRETSTKTNCVFKESDDSEPSQEASSIVPFPTRSTTSHPAILSSESSSGGRVHIMILLSSAVARLIGHSGNTINGIRAASGAIIVIEKYKPMEKNTQMISIKGDVKDVRKAVKMIEMLIHDADTPVREIINRIMRDSIHVENTTPNRFALSKRMRYNSSSERNSCSQASYYEEKAFESDSNLMPTKSGSTLDLHFEALPSDLSKTPEKESNSKKVVKEENSEYPIVEVKPKNPRKPSIIEETKELEACFIKAISIFEAESRANNKTSLEKRSHMPEKLILPSTSIGASEIDDMKISSPLSPSRRVAFVSAWSVLTSSESNESLATFMSSKPELPLTDKEEELRRKAPGYARPMSKKFFSQNSVRSSSLAINENLDGYKNSVTHSCPGIFLPPLTSATNFEHKTSIQPPATSKFEFPFSTPVVYSPNKNSENTNIPVGQNHFPKVFTDASPPLENNLYNRSAMDAAHQRSSQSNFSAWFPQSTPVKQDPKKPTMSFWQPQSSSFENTEDEGIENVMMHPTPPDTPFLPDINVREPITTAFGQPPRTLPTQLQQQPHFNSPASYIPVHSPLRHRLNPTATNTLGNYAILETGNYYQVPSRSFQFPVHTIPIQSTSYTQWLNHHPQQILTSRQTPTLRHADSYHQFYHPDSQSILGQGISVQKMTTPDARTFSTSNVYARPWITE